MSELETRCLDAFPLWLESLATDASDLGELIRDSAVDETARQYAAGALNYLFKSLDLIPDGIEDLGFLDDAFVLRVAAALALAEAPKVRDQAPVLVRLAEDAPMIAELLGEHHPRLEAYVQRLKSGTARGRSVDEILRDEGIRRDFLNEVAGWSKSYDCPSFSRDEKNIVKLRSFLAAKLPAS